MKIKAIAPWFGSKRTLAPEIVSELGAHSDYWEPFCGSMAVLLAKPPARNETVNDLHGDLVNLAMVIQDPTNGARLYRKLRRTLFCEGWHRKCQQPLEDSKDDPVERAYRYFVTCWMSLSGIAGTRRAETKLCIRYTSTGGDPVVRFRNATQSIPAWMKRLRRVRILNRDAIGIIEKIPDIDGVAIYLDPPYLKKGASYKHDFESDDHLRLAQSVSRLRHARVVISYYDHPRLQELYSGWTRRDLQQRKALVCQSARDMKGVKAVAPEVLLINGPSYAAVEGLFL